MKKEKKKKKKREIRTKSKGEEFAIEPAGGEGALGDGEGLSTETVEEAAKDADPVVLELDAEGEDDLAKEDERAEQEGTLTHSRETIDDEATKESENYVGPRVDRVEETVVGVGVVVGRPSHR